MASTENTTLTDTILHLKMEMQELEKITIERNEPLESAHLLLQVELLQSSKEKKQLVTNGVEMRQEMNKISETVVALQREKREFVKAKEEDSSFCDTYEEVMKEEFVIMKSALVRRAQAAEERIISAEKEKVDQVHKAHQVTQVDNIGHLYIMK